MLATPITQEHASIFLVDKGTFPASPVFLVKLTIKVSYSKSSPHLPKSAIVDYIPSKQAKMTRCSSVDSKQDENVAKSGLHITSKTSLVKLPLNTLPNGVSSSSPELILS